MSLPTIPEALARATQGGRGGVVLRESSGEQRLSWAEVDARAARFAAGLAAAGVAPGDRALLLLPTSLDLLDAFFGCARAGVTSCQLSPPEGFGSGPGFDRRLEQVVALLEPALVVTDADLAPRLEAVLSVPVRLAADLTASEGPAPTPELGPDDLAFIQLTSGTTAAPKGVQITHGALAANTEQIAVGSGMDAQSVVVSWLPMFHDMGLVGFLTALYRDLTGVLMRPSTFLRRPKAWLQAIHDHRGTHSPAPTFAYQYTAARLSRRPLPAGELDLSSWRVAYVGAEPIRADVLHAFQHLLAPHGLAPTTIFPCYGMAEATLALTFKPVDQPYRVVRVDRDALAEGVVVVDPEGLNLVSCGVPLPPTTIEVVDPDETPLPESRIGEVVVDGPSLFRGYWGQPDRVGPFHTGDLGFLRDGELFITGRKKDLIILRGHNHHPEEIEWIAAKVEGVRSGRVAAFGLPDEATGTERLVLMAEHDKRSGVESGALALALRRAVHTGAGLPLDEVLLVGAGELPTTTSGKVRRSGARDLFNQRGPWKEPTP